LCQEHFAAALPGVSHLIEDVSRGLEDDALCSELACQPFELDAVDFGDVGFAFERRIHFQRLCLVPIQHQRGLEDAVDANDVRPANLELGLGGVRLDGFLRSGRRRRSVLAPFVRQKRERHAEDVDVFGVEATLTRTTCDAARGRRLARTAVATRTPAVP
jgi:hypothetical protein